MLRLLGVYPDKFLIRTFDNDDAEQAFGNEKIFIFKLNEHQFNSYNPNKTPRLISTVEIDLLELIGCLSPS